MAVGQVTPPVIVEQAKRLLLEGHSRNYVQVTLKLAKTTVERIDNGTYRRDRHTTGARVCKRHKCYVVNRSTGECVACQAEKKAAETLANQRAMLNT